jgi:ubiquinol-cytochrome c reductase cytochrome b subunit
VQLLLAGPIIAGETLSRFFTLHVFVLPGAILAIVSLHLRLVLTKGVSEYPTPGSIVRKASYEIDYARLVHNDGVPFAPHVISKDLIFAGVVMLGIATCAAVFGPHGPSGPPDPSLIDTAPKPDFYYLAVYTVLALLPPYMETFLLLTAPVAGIVLLLLVPFIAGTGEKSARRRPVAVLTVIFAFLVLGTLAGLGTYAPWSPHMNAWSGDTLPVRYLQGRTPLERRGAILIQSKQCRNCHALDGSGGLRGPALDGVASRLTKDQLIRQVVQGGGNMPAYGKNVTPAEVTAIVAFMTTLR